MWFDSTSYEHSLRELLIKIYNADDHYSLQF